MAFLVVCTDSEQDPDNPNSVEFEIKYIFAITPNLFMHQYIRETMVKIYSLILKLYPDVGRDIYCPNNDKILKVANSNSRITRTKRIENCGAKIAFAFDILTGDLKVGKVNSTHCHIGNALTDVYRITTRHIKEIVSRHSESLLSPSCLNNITRIESEFNLTSRQLSNLTYTNSGNKLNPTLDIQTLLKNLETNDDATYVALYSVSGQESAHKIQIKFPSLNGEPTQIFDLPANAAFEPYD
eukprot:Awhi_evm1s9143